MKLGQIFKNGIFTENPIFVQVIGMCPTLAVTTNAANGISMGLATTVALSFTNLAISLSRRFIPDKIRIPSFVVIIAGIVTVIEIMMKAFASDMYRSLGIYIPLIVVNCIILARAEAFASKNKPLPSFVDGIAVGLGFTLAMAALGIVREFIGSGSFFGLTVLPEAFPRTALVILPPGAFITLGLLMALLAYIRAKRKSKAGEAAR